MPCNVMMVTSLDFFIPVTAFIAAGCILVCFSSSLLKASFINMKHFYFFFGSICSTVLLLRVVLILLLSLKCPSIYKLLLCKCEPLSCVWRVTGWLMPKKKEGGQSCSLLGFSTKAIVFQLPQDQVCAWQCVTSEAPLKLSWLPHWSRAKKHHQMTPHPVQHPCPNGPLVHCSVTRGFDGLSAAFPFHHSAPSSLVMLQRVFIYFVDLFPLSPANTHPTVEWSLFADMSVQARYRVPHEQSSFQWITHIFVFSSKAFLNCALVYHSPPVLLNEIL